MDNRIISSNINPSDDWQFSLRPRRLSEYIGQDKVIANLKVFINAALNRNEPLDHVLLYGPTGLGKTTLAAIIANELGVNFKQTSAPAISRSGDLAALLTNLHNGDVLFIDEIHRLSRNLEEILYSAMEDFALDIIIGKGPHARNFRLDIAPFTLVAATTRPASLSPPFRDRFGVFSNLDFYSVSAVIEIINRAAEILKISIEENGAAEIAKRSRGTPRIANRLLKRVRDFAQYSGSTKITKEIAEKSLDALEIDKAGLSSSDRKILEAIITKYGGGPVGVETLAATLSETRETIEDVYEPYLMQIGYIMRTARGRVVTQAGYEHLKMLTP